MTKKQQQSSLKALEAAELSFKDGMHATMAAKSLGISRSTITQARLILEFGSDQDRYNAYAGKIGLRTISNKIRKGLSAEAKEELKRRSGGKPTEKYRNALDTDKALWAKLGPALRNLNELPNPKELITVVKSNQQRKQIVNALLSNAVNWIEEFTNEWKRSEESPSNS